MNPKQQANRTQRGEVVGGGYFVFRRGRTSKRIKPDLRGFPFEHATLQAAEAEASRLARLNPGNQFVVLQQVSAVTHYFVPADDIVAGSLEDA